MKVGGSVAVEDQANEAVDTPYTSNDKDASKFRALGFCVDPCAFSNRESWLMHSRGIKFVPHCDRWLCFANYVQLTPISADQTVAHCIGVHSFSSRDLNPLMCCTRLKLCQVQLAELVPYNIWPRVSINKNCFLPCIIQTQICQIQHQAADDEISNSLAITT